MTTATKESVVTPERFKSGMTWNQYLAYIQTRKRTPGPPDAGRRPREATRMSSASCATWAPGRSPTMRREALQELPRLKMLVLGEDWCPDVYRGLPVLAEIAANRRLGAAHLRPRREQRHYVGVPQGRPARVDSDRRALHVSGTSTSGHWIERPAVANEHMANMQKLFSRKEGESEDEMRARIRQGYRDLQSSDEWPPGATRPSTRSSSWYAATPRPHKPKRNPPPPSPLPLSGGGAEGGGGRSLHRQIPPPSCSSRHIKKLDLSRR